MKTAVEWFAKELNNWRIKEFGEDSIIGIPSEVFEKAKKMEKEQIMNAWLTTKPTTLNYWRDEFEQYYNETFKQE
jgi:hypothetical protein